MVTRCSVRTSLLFLILSLAAPGLFPQAREVPQVPRAAIPVRLDYVLGPNDQILVRAPEAAEINERPFRIDPDGYIDLPIVGRVRAGGLTIQALEADIVARLSEYIREPKVFVTLVQFRSEPVFFVGAFHNPGIYPLQGRRTLIEMLSAVGGIQSNASRRIKITRRAEYGVIPLLSAIEAADKKISTVEISLASLTEDVNPEEDIVLNPYDVVTVGRAERVYVSGEVTKVGALELGERDSMSVAQALTEAGGFTPTATRDRVRVLRPILGTNRRAEIEIDLKRVFSGQASDFPLLPNDVLYVPRSSRRSVLTAVGSALLVSGPYIVVTALIR